MATRPTVRLNQYKEAARRMARGIFTGDLPSGDDELGQLGESLNDLAQVLEKNYQQGQLLAGITEEINAGLFLEEVLNYVYESFRSVIPYDRIGFAVLEEDGRTLRAHWARAEYGGPRLILGFRADIAKSSLQRIIRDGKPRIINDTEAYLKANPDSRSTRLIVKEGIRSSLTCPLVAMNKAVGFLFFSSRERNTYRDLHQQFFVKIANQLSTILEKSRLYQQLFEVNQQLASAKRDLEYQATHDALTGTLNRAAIIQRLQSGMEENLSAGAPLGAVMLDIDHFKRVNDTYGHAAGDAVLREITRRISDDLREGEWLGRYGGEEFLLVVSPGDNDAAIAAAERIHQLVRSAPVMFESKPIAVTMSIGLATTDTFGKISVDRLTQYADQALYRAKEHGRDRVVVAARPHRATIVMSQDDPDQRFASPALRPTGRFAN